MLRKSKTGLTLKVCISKVMYFFFLIYAIVQPTDILWCVGTCYLASDMHRIFFIAVNRLGVLGGRKKIKISDCPHDFMEEFRKHLMGVLG